MPSHVTREGKHGTLYLYAVPYEGEFDGDVAYWRCYAYSAEHAVCQFDDDSEEEGYVRCGEPFRVKRRG